MYYTSDVEAKEDSPLHTESDGMHYNSENSKDGQVSVKIEN